MRWSGAAKLSLLRHGESENNVLGVNCSALGNRELYGLTATGREQAQAAANTTQRFDEILHSPLRRARETAEILEAAWGTRSIEEPLLVEVQLGIFENRPEQDFRTWKGETGKRAHPSGESNAAVQSRVQDLLARVEETYGDSSVLLVTHGTLIRHILSSVYDEVDWSWYQQHSENGRRIVDLRDSISRVDGLDHGTA